jgi:hypothetical protein
MSEHSKYSASFNDLLEASELTERSYYQFQQVKALEKPNSFGPFL